MRVTALFSVFLAFWRLFAGAPLPVFGYLPLFFGKICAKLASGCVLDRIFVYFLWFGGSKIDQKSTKIGICGRSALQVFFSGLNLHLKLVFASTSEPANLDFDATLTGFVRFLRFQEDRIKNDFTTIFDALEAPKITPKSTKNQQKIN